MLFVKLNITNSCPDEPGENHQKEVAQERKQEVPERKHDLSRHKDPWGNSDDHKLPYAESNDVLSINTLPSSVEETLENGFRSRISQLSSVSPVSSSIPLITGASKPLQGDLCSSLMKYEPYQIMKIDQGNLQLKLHNTKKLKISCFQNLLTGPREKNYTIL